jgi:D-aminopeptidase
MATFQEATMSRGRGWAALGLLAATLGVQAQEARPRARDLALAPGVLPPGPLNAITDVAGVRVGQVTIISGTSVRTGVTAVVPHPGNVFQDKVAAGVFVGNAFGKLAGSTQVEELGTLETPVVLTNTLSVGTAVEAVVAETLAQPGNEDVRSVNAVVGEINDGYLSDIRGFHVTRDHVRTAIREARPGPVAEGSVGGGTGAIAFGYKGGIGTSSRVLPERYGGYTLGVLVQANFGGVLIMDGVPVGEAINYYAFASDMPPSGMAAAGSCLIVVATDAPLDARELRRLAARAVFGLARTGSSFYNGSGDYAVAFSTSPEARSRHGETKPRARTLLPSEAVSPLFEAVLEATEEAVLNAILQATDMTGNGRTIPALPMHPLREILKAYGHPQP